MTTEARLQIQPVLAGADVGDVRRSRRPIGPAGGGMDLPDFGHQRRLGAHHRSVLGVEQVRAEPHPMIRTHPWRAAANAMTERRVNESPEQRSLHVDAAAVDPDRNRNTPGGAVIVV